MEKSAAIMAASMFWSTTSGAAKACSNGTSRSGTTISTTACACCGLAIDTHLITAHYALPLLIERPGGPAGRSHRRHPRLQRDALPAVGLLRSLQGRGRPHQLGARQGSGEAWLHGFIDHARLDALRNDARTLQRHRGDMEGRRSPSSRISRFRKRRASSAVLLRRLLPTTTRRAGTASRCRAGRSPRNTASTTSTARGRIAGGILSRCARRESRPMLPAIGEVGGRAFPSRPSQVLPTKE